MKFIEKRLIQKKFNTKIYDFIYFCFAFPQSMNRSEKDGFTESQKISTFEEFPETHKTGFEKREFDFLFI